MQQRNLKHGCPTHGPRTACGPPPCVILTPATFANYVCTLKIAQYVGWLRIPFSVICPRADRELAAITGVVIFRKKAGDSF